MSGNAASRAAAGAKGWLAPLFREVDGSSLAVFRMGFGAIMLWECLRYIYLLCIECYFTEPDVLFKYYGFGWVQPLSEDGMYAVFWVLAVLSAGIMLGAWYRLCTLLFTLLFSWMFLLDQARYLNHFYMVILFAALLCVVPAQRKWSVDAWRKPRLAMATVPRWALLLLVLQLEVILLYAGIAKLNLDWLNLEPLRMWLAGEADLPLVGALFVQDWALAAAAWGVIALHLVGAPLLLVRQTRLLVLGIYAAFHCLNHLVFNIGIFPWFTLFASLLFFDPDWPLQLRDRAVRLLGGHPPATIQVLPQQSALAVSGWQTAGVAGFVGLWLLVQVLVPLRHWAYPGDVAWNEEGHRFSWRMKLRSKEGRAVFVVRRQDGATWLEDPRDWLSAKQARKMVCIPDMVLQFAHMLAADAAKAGGGPVQVYANAQCSLNGRPRQPLVDQTTDLAQVPRDLGHNTWVLPLREPLPNPFLGFGK